MTIPSRELIANIESQVKKIKKLNIKIPPPPSKLLARNSPVFTGTPCCLFPQIDTKNSSYTNKKKGNCQKHWLERRKTPKKKEKRKKKNQERPGNESSNLLSDTPKITRPSGFGPIEGIRRFIDCYDFWHFRLQVLDPS